MTRPGNEAWSPGQGEPPLHIGVVAFEKWAFGSPLNKVANLLINNDYANNIGKGVTFFYLGSLRPRQTSTRD